MSDKPHMGELLEADSVDLFNAAESRIRGLAVSDLSSGMHYRLFVAAALREMAHFEEQDAKLKVAVEILSKIKIICDDEARDIYNKVRAIREEIVS